MLARPFASATVIARAVCRLKLLGRCEGGGGSSCCGLEVEEIGRGRAWSEGPVCEAVVPVNSHGPYLNGRRNASPAAALGTAKTSWVALRISATTIWVSPVSRLHSSETL